MATSSPGGGGLREWGDLTEFSLDTLRSVPGSLRYFSEVLRQAAILVRGSSFMIASMAFFLGISVTNFGYYILKAAGATDFTGLIAGVANPRVASGIIFGYAFAAKIGCGLASEIGAMRINEELDALESQAVSPLRYAVATKVCGALLFTPIAAGFALLFCMAGAQFTALNVLHALPKASFDQYAWGLQGVPDELFALVTMMVCAVAIILVGAYYGFRASGGPPGVGSAVARSLLVNLVLIHVITGVCEFAVYGTNPHLPIGG
jgi:phospholipid/cholesterol/gamma-HCH transport system permease protein